MKKLIYFLSAAAILSGCSSGEPEKKGNVSVKGTLTGAAGETVMLVDLNSQNKVVIDSAKVNENGEFTLVANTKEIGFFNVKISESNFCMLILDTSDQAVLTGDAKDLGNTYSVQGSPSTSLFLELNEFTRKNSN